MPLKISQRRNGTVVVKGVPETPVEALEGVRRLLEYPQYWTKGALAKDPNGFPIVPTDTFARCWCLQGAFEKIGYLPSYTNTSHYNVRWALEGVLSLLRTRSIAEYNDAYGTTHAKVIALLDRAIAKEKKTAAHES